jgi:sugar phosphate isomerase/epimerase
MIWMHSYTYRGQSLQLAARKAVQYGYEGLELVTLHYDRKNLASIEEAAKTARAAGTRIAVVDYAGSVIVDDGDERQRNQEHQAEVIRAAARIGAEGVNGSIGSLMKQGYTNYGENGSALATDEHYERGAEAYRALGEVAREYGIWISFEIHMNTPHDTAASTKRLTDMIDLPNVFANLDPGNMYSTNTAEPAAEAVQILGSRLGYVHLKNCREIGGGYDYTWSLENGDLDFARIIKAVVASGYQGPYCIEYCGKGDPSVPAERDVRYLRELLSEAMNS